MVSGKGSFKDLKFCKECMAHEIFCHPAIWKFSMADRIEKMKEMTSAKIRL